MNPLADGAALVRHLKAPHFIYKLNWGFWGWYWWQGQRRQGWEWWGWVARLQTDNSANSGPTSQPLASPTPPSPPLVYFQTVARPQAFKTFIRVQNHGNIFRFIAVQSLFPGPIRLKRYFNRLRVTLVSTLGIVETMLLYLPYKKFFRVFFLRRLYRKKKKWLLFEL